MASITQELIDTLKEEAKIYDELIPISKQKKKFIISNDVEEVKKMSTLEKDILDRLLFYENTRRRILKDVANVMNREYSSLKLSDIIKMLDKQPAEQKELSILHDSLKSKVNELMQINNHNTSLIKQSLDMIEFNMNFIQSTWMSVGNNSYDNFAKHVEGSVNDTISGRFDARQ